MIELSNVLLSITLFQGVRVGDLVVEFGSVNVDNFKNLQDIGSLVQHSQGVGNIITLS